MLLKNIQFLRGAAALAVVFYHLAPRLMNSQHVMDALHVAFAQFGYAGVDVFFVISGYVIWISTHGKAVKSNPAEFAYKRAARIYLGYWPYYLLITLLVWFLAPEKIESVNMVGSFFLTELTIPKLILQVAWTLSFELYFYLIFTACLFFSVSRSQLILICFGLLILLLQAYAVFGLDMYAMENLPQAPALFTFFFSPFCLQFLAGVSIAIYFEKYRLKQVSGLLLFGAIVFVFTIWYQSQILPDGHYLSMGYYAPIRALLFGLVAVSLVASMVELELRGIQVLPRFGAWFGDASYSLYLSHIPMLFIFSKVGMIAWAQSAEWQHVMAVFIIISTILIYSVVHYRLIERPLMQWSKRKGHRIFSR